MLDCREVIYQRSSLCSKYIFATTFIIIYNSLRQKVNRKRETVIESLPMNSTLQVIITSTYPSLKVMIEFKSIFIESKMTAEFVYYWGFIVQSDDVRFFIAFQRHQISISWSSFLTNCQHNRSVNSLIDIFAICYQ